MIDVALSDHLDEAEAYLCVLVGALPLLNEASVNLIEREDDALLTVSLEGEATDTELRLAMLVLADGELVVVDYLANGRDVEEAKVVFEGDKEDSIIFSLVIDLLEQLRGPERRGVAPVAVPFLQAPGVPNLHKPHSLVSIFDFLAPDQGVGVRIHEASLFNLLSRLMYGSALHCRPDHKVFEICIGDDLPQFLFILNIFVVQHMHGGSSERGQGFSCLATLYSLVTSKDLGPGFL